MNRLPSSLEQRKTALRDNRYLQGLEEQSLEDLAEKTHLLSYASEESIIHEGQPGPGLFIIQSGRVKIYKCSPMGREMIINVLGDGESFNEVPVFDQGENPASVAALVESRLWLIDAQALRTLINDHPQAARQIITNLTQNLRMLVDKVAELSFYTVTARLASLLQELPESQLEGGSPDRLTQDELAARVGTVREVVSRSLKELENDGAIAVQRGRIRILDREKLANWKCA